MRTGLPSFKVSGPPHLHAANPPTFKASVCRERAAGPHCTQAPSDRGTSVVSHTGVETPTTALSPAAALANFHTIECTDQASLSRRAKPRPRRPRPAVLGSAWQATGKCNLRYATRTTRSRLGTGVHWVSVCGHALRARSATWVPCGRVQTSGLSERADRWRWGGQRAPTGCRDHAQSVEPEASRLWVVSQASLLALVTARSAQVVLCKQTSNPSLQRTVQQRRCACCWPAAELWRSAAC